MAKLKVLSDTLAQDEDRLPPILAGLRRELQGMTSDTGSYLKYLERKYR